MTHHPVVFVLDIETAKTSFAHPEKSVLAFVGLSCYFYEKRSFKVGYRHFSPKELEALRKILLEIPGIIVGHNLFGFDYRVLGELMDLRGIIEKSVDTFYFLRSKNGGARSGLSLKSLSILNSLGFKGFDTKYMEQYDPWMKEESVSKLWNKGERRKVYKYNRNDCELTYRLWDKLTTDKKVTCQFFKKIWGCEVRKNIRVSKKDLQILSGRKKTFTYSTWREWVAKKEFVVPANNDITTVIPVAHCLRCGGVNTQSAISPEGSHYLGYPYVDVRIEGLCRCGKCGGNFYYDWVFSITAGAKVGKRNRLNMTDKKVLSVVPIPRMRCPICENTDTLVQKMDPWNIVRTDKDEEEYFERSVGRNYCSSCDHGFEYNYIFTVKNTERRLITIPAKRRSALVIAPCNFSISSYWGAISPRISLEYQREHRISQEVG